MTGNSSVFTDFIYWLTPELEASFEYKWISTTESANISRRNNYLDVVSAYRF